MARLPGARRGGPGTSTGEHSQRPALAYVHRPQGMAWAHGMVSEARARDVVGARTRVSGAGLCHACMGANKLALWWRFIQARNVCCRVYALRAFLSPACMHGPIVGVSDDRSVVRPLYIRIPLRLTRSHDRLADRESSYS